MEVLDNLLFFPLQHEFNVFEVFFDLIEHF